MSVDMRNGIGYGQKSNAMYIDMAATKNLLPAKPIQDTLPQDQLNSFPWSPWGSNNLLPLEMLADIKATPLLNSILEGQARFTMCEGIVPVITRVDGDKKVIDKYLSDEEINAFLEGNDSFNQFFGMTKDLLAFNRSVMRIMLTRDQQKIARFKRDDVTETRMEKKDHSSRIRNIWYSAEWNKVKGVDSEYIFKKPHLDPVNPLADLQMRLSSGDKATEFAISNTHPGWNEQYYPVPMWMSAIKWIKIAQSIPEMKAAMYENSIRAKFVVIIYEAYWEKQFGDAWSKGTAKEQEEIRQKAYDQIEDFLVGAENAGKSIFVTGYRDRDGKTWAEVEFKPIDDRATNGEYLPDSAAANSEIAFALLWNNAMTGGNQKNGLYSQNEGGSNVREASTLQVILHEVHRQNIKKSMYIVKHFNGWAKKYPGLEFIIPATILTTLDTGAGSKAVVPGNTSPSNNNNGTN